MTKSPNGFGGATGAFGDVDTFPALSPKIDSTATSAVNGVTAACDTGASDSAGEATTVELADNAAGTTDETPDVRAVGAVEDAVEDTTALSGVLGVAEADGVVTETFIGAGREVVALSGVTAVTAGGVGVTGVGVDAGEVVAPVGSAAGVAGAASLAGAVGASVGGATGSDVVRVAAGGVAVDAALELPADVVEDDEADDGEVDLVDSKLELPAEMVDDGDVDVIDSKLELPAEMVDDGDVDLFEVVPTVGEDVARVAAGPSEAALDVLSSLLELLDDDEEESDALPGSAWARPEPLINAAPRPTVIAEFLTHVGTSWVLGVPCRPRPDFAALAARALALARFFTR